MPSRSCPAFLAAEMPPPPPERARFHILPVPYEKTVSYGHGAARGPAAILRASQYLELFTGSSQPAVESGIHTCPPVPCGGEAPAVLRRISGRVGEILKQDKIPVVLGGEHTVSYAPVAALVEARGTGFGVVHFDAHADLRAEYHGTKWSHACVMRHIHELELPVAQFGVRSLSWGEHQYRLDHDIFHLDAATLAEEGIPAVPLPDEFPEALYLTFDIDAFDPSLVPGTGTPEPGGLFWHDALRLLRGVLAGRRLLGFDVVELAPLRGSTVSDFTAARLVYEIMGMAAR
ncbi:MAG: agmatinase [Lentisphaeria bacterium]